MAAAAAGESTRLIGVRKKGEDKFGAAIMHPVTKTFLWLGTYSLPEVAACAYDLAARELKGAKAKLNFAYPPPARLVKEVITAPRHRSHGHEAPLFQVVTLPPDPTSPPPPPPKLVVYFPFPIEVPASNPPPVPAYPFLHMPRPARARLSPQPAHAPAPKTQPPIQRMNVMVQAESCLSSSGKTLGASSSRRLVFNKPKLVVVPVTLSAPTEGTGDNFTKPWYCPDFPVV
ncbi:lysine-rich arabinogalactan protein 19-like [Triticum dicoccoides]|uniref:lysine-rich arabinogalactan protein 19-like n=1 Tax=Triticum dicoccoides TaxID=85692 RepID=UPI001890E0A9|nr:lysine-rich arabinogalactan protein 19-like [Triticum dicoccoides]